jgi:hypothetical protein
MTCQRIAWREPLCRAVDSIEYHETQSDTSHRLTVCELSRVVSRVVVVKKIEEVAAKSVTKPMFFVGQDGRYFSETNELAGGTRTGNQVKSGASTVRNLSA